MTEPAIPKHHEGVFSIDLDEDVATEASATTGPIITHKPAPTLADLAYRKGRLHRGGKKSKKNRRRSSKRHRVRSSRRR